MRNGQITPLAILLLSGTSLAQICTSSTLTTGVNPKVTDFAAFEAEIAPFTATATGANVPVYTDTVNLGATIVTAVGYAKSDALVAAGYTVTSGPSTFEAPCLTTTSTAPTQTGALPPKPSGNCTAHGDHWHCDEEDHDDHDEDDHDHSTTTSTPSSTSTAPAIPSPTDGKNCTAHGDHWHCDEEEEHDEEETGTKTTATPSTPSPTNGINCTAHDDHWHCDEEEEHDDHDHDKEETGTKTTATPSTPSPTNGINCTAHGDHWHCDDEDDGEGHSLNGTTTATNSTPTSAPVKETDENGAGGLKISAVLAGGLGAAVLALLM